MEFLAKTDAEAQAAEFHARESWPVPPPVAPPPKTALERLWSKAKGAEPDKEPTRTLASGIAIAELKERLVERERSQPRLKLAPQRPRTVEAGAKSALTAKTRSVTRAGEEAASSWTRSLSIRRRKAADAIRQVALPTERALTLRRRQSTAESIARRTDEAVAEVAPPRAQLACPRMSFFTGPEVGMDWPASL